MQSICAIDPISLRPLLVILRAELVGVRFPGWSPFPTTSSTVEASAEEA